MKCFEGENPTDSGCPNPLHTLPWLHRVQPWARTPHWVAPRHPLRKMGGQSVEVRDAQEWPALYVTLSGQEGKVALETTHQWGAAS